MVQAMVFSDGDLATQVVPLRSEFALGAARLILQYSARSQLGKGGWDLPFGKGISP